MSDPTPESSRPVPRFSRTAWLVLGAALLSGGGLTAVGTFIPGGAVDKEQIVWMGALIGGVFGLWAVVLALRALWRGERTASPLWLLNLAALLAATYGLWLWLQMPEKNEFDWKVDTGLPIALPFAAIVCVSGTILLRWAMRWVERRRVRVGKPALTQRERNWLALKLGAPYVLLLALILLPVPVFLFFAAREFKEEPSAFLKATPNFIRDPAESLARTGMQWKWADAWRRVEIRLLSNNLVSDARLATRGNDPDLQWKTIAIRALVTHDPKLSARFAVEAIESAPANNGTIFFELTGIVAAHGTSDERKRVLRLALVKSASPGHLYKFISFFEVLQKQPRDDGLIPLMKEVLEAQPLDRWLVLNPLIEWLPDEEAMQLITAELDSGNFVRERDAVVFLRLERLSLWKRVFFMELGHQDINVRRLAVGNSHLMSIAWKVNGKMQIECVRKLLPLMDAEDVVVRRGAARALNDFCKLGANLGTDDIFRGQSKISVFSGGIPLPETTEETAAFKKIHAGAEEWLKRNDK